MSSRRLLLAALPLLLSCEVALAGQPIQNWSAPSAWTPSRTVGVHTLADVTNPLPFIGITPCRAADTRGNGFAGAYGPPALVANATRSFTITGQCGIPASAAAVSFNFGALNVGGAGDLRVFPAGGSVPLVSTMNYNASTPNIANAAVVPLGTGGAITVQADAVSIDLIIDINGYYASTPATSTNGFVISGSGSYAIYGLTSGTSTFAAGVEGSATGSSGITFGVSGRSLSSDPQSAGVNGQSEAGGIGVSGGSESGIGVRGLTLTTSDLSPGVLGIAGSTTGITYGVQGVTDSVSSFVSSSASGVFGIDGAGAQGGNQGGFASSGVEGRGQNGIVGRTSLSGGNGVSGVMQNTAGLATYGVLGTTTHGVWAFVGDIGCSSCTKAFVDPHPTDPGKEIRFVSLEGNEAGTYFRGTAETVGKEFVIQVPEEFRMVTDAEGLTVQLTPVGAPASMYVVTEDLNQIVVRSSRDVRFHYLVQGIRPAYKDFKPIQEMSAYLPQTAEGKMMQGWSEWTRRRLIANGTYLASTNPSIAPGILPMPPRTAAVNA